MSEVAESGVTVGQVSSHNEDMMDPCQELENPPSISFDKAQQVTLTSLNKADNGGDKASSNLTILSNTPLVSPIIIGNVHAANALSSVFRNEQITNSASNELLPSSLNSDLASSVMPIFLNPRNASEVSTSTSYSNENSCSSVNLEKKNDEITRTNNVPICHGTQRDIKNTSEPSMPIPSLSSSDTMILTSESSETACAVKDLASEILLAANDKKLSLLSNISERSVSLDSIPSLTLFKPGVSDAESGVCTEESLRGVAVISSDKVPAWLVQLMKKRNNFIVSSGKDDNLANNKTISVEPITQDKVIGVCERSANSLDEDKGQEETDMDYDETPVTKRETLKRSDTLILPTYETPAKTTSNEQGSVEANVPFESITSGVSFSSVSTMSVDPAELVNEQSAQDSTTSKHVLEMSGTITDLLSSNISQILYPVKITSDSLRFDLVGINETNSSTLRHVSPGEGEQSLSYSLGNSPILMVCGDTSSSSRLAEAKETQTDLALGTNTVYFKTVNDFQGTTQFEAGQLPTTILTVTASTSASHCDTGQALQLTQSKLVTPSDEEMPVSLISPTPNATLSQHNIEFVASTALSNFSQEIKSTSDSSNVENSEDTSYKCTVCDEKFSSADELVLHKRSHKTFKCDLCNASFSRMGNYSRHRKIHNLHAENQSGFQCDDCGRKFLQRCDLKRHCLIHTRQEPYRCDICNKGYIRRSDLIVHMRFHNKDRAFHCSFCDKKFFQSGDLNRHVRRAHQPNSELTCGHCDRKYACETTLIRHMKAVHKDIILQAVNQRMQDQNSTDKTSAVSSKDILFTMKQKQ